MTVYNTQTEYAEHRGISQPRVSRMIGSGKIPKNCIKSFSGKKLIDRDKADKALSENLDKVHNPSDRRKKTNQKRKPRVDPDIVESQVAALDKAGRELVTLNEAQTIKANYDALLKELEYNTKTGELIPADSVKKAISDMVLVARGKILAINGSLAPLLKEFIEDKNNFGIAMERVDQALRDILTEIAQAKV